MKEDNELKKNVPSELNENSDLLNENFFNSFNPSAKLQEKKRKITDLTKALKSNPNYLKLTENQEKLPRLYDIILGGLVENNNNYVLSQIDLIDVLGQNVSSQKEFKKFYDKAMPKLFDKFYLQNQKINESLSSMFGNSIAHKAMSLKDYYPYIETIATEEDDDYKVNVLNFLNKEVNANKDVTLEEMPKNIVDSLTKLAHDDNKDISEISFNLIETLNNRDNTSNHNNSESNQLSSNNTQKKEQLSPKESKLAFSSFIKKISDAVKRGSNSNPINNKQKNVDNNINNFKNDGTNSNDNLKGKKIPENLDNEMYIEDKNQTVLPTPTLKKNNYGNVSNNLNQDQKGDDYYDSYEKKNEELNSRNCNETNYYPNYYNNLGGNTNENNYINNEENQNRNNINLNDWNNQKEQNNVELGNNTPQGNNENIEPPKVIRVSLNKSPCKKSQNEEPSKIPNDYQNENIIKSTNDNNAKGISTDKIKSDNNIDNYNNYNNYNNISNYNYNTEDYNNNGNYNNADNYNNTGNYNSTDDYNKKAENYNNGENYNNIDSYKTPENYNNDNQYNNNENYNSGYNYNENYGKNIDNNNTQNYNNNDYYNNGYNYNYNGYNNGNNNINYENYNYPEYYKNADNYNYNDYYKNTDNYNNATDYNNNENYSKNVEDNNKNIDNYNNNDNYSKNSENYAKNNENNNTEQNNNKNAESYNTNENYNTNTNYNNNDNNYNNVDYYNNEKNYNNTDIYNTNIDSYNNTNNYNSNIDSYNYGNNYKNTENYTNPENNNKNEQNYGNINNFNNSNTNYNEKVCNTLSDIQNEKLQNTNEPRENKNEIPLNNNQDEMNSLPIEKNRVYNRDYIEPVEKEEDITGPEKNQNTKDLKNKKSKGPFKSRINRPRKLGNIKTTKKNVKSNNKNDENNDEQGQDQINRNIDNQEMKKEIENEINEDKIRNNIPKKDSEFNQYKENYPDKNQPNNDEKPIKVNSLYDPNKREDYMSDIKKGKEKYVDNDIDNFLASQNYGDIIDINKININSNPNDIEDGLENFVVTKKRDIHPEDNSNFKENDMNPQKHYYNNEIKINNNNNDYNNSPEKNINGNAEENNEFENYVITKPNKSNNYPNKNYFNNYNIPEEQNPYTENNIGSEQENYVVTKNKPGNDFKERPKNNIDEDGFENYVVTKKKSNKFPNSNNFLPQNNNNGENLLNDDGLENYVVTKKKNNNENNSNNNINNINIQERKNLENDIKNDEGIENFIVTKKNKDSFPGIMKNSNHNNKIQKNNDNINTEPKMVRNIDDEVVGPKKNNILENKPNDFINNNNMPIGNDEEVIPAQSHKNKNFEQLLEYELGLENEKEKSNILETESSPKVSGSTNKKDDPKFDSIKFLLGDEIVKALSSPKWEIKKHGYELINNFVLENPLSSSTLNELCEYIKFKLKNFKETNFNINREAINIFISMCEKRYATKEILNQVILGYHDKLADPKLKDNILELINSSFNIVSPDSIIQQLIKKLIKKSNSKVLIEYANLFGKIIDDYDIKELPTKELIDYCKYMANNTNPQVRTAGTNLLCVLYKYLGPDLKILLKDIKESTLKIIEAELNKVEVIPSQGTHIKTKKSEAFSEENKNKNKNKEQSNTGFEGLGPFDISKKITSQLIKDISEGKWQEKKEACETIEKILVDTNMKILPDGLNEFFELVRSKLSDCNKNLVKMLISLLTKFIQALKQDFKTWTKPLALSLIPNLADKSPMITNECKLCFDKWVECVGLETLVVHFPQFLKTENADMRIGIMKFIKKYHKKFSKNIADTVYKESMDGLLQCLLDRSGNVRSKAEEIIKLSLIYIPLENYLKKAKDFKPAIADSLKTILDKIGENPIVSSEEENDDNNYDLRTKSRLSNDSSHIGEPRNSSANFRKRRGTINNKNCNIKISNNNLDGNNKKDNKENNITNENENSNNLVNKNKGANRSDKNLIKKIKGNNKINKNNNKNNINTQLNDESENEENELEDNNNKKNKPQSNKNNIKINKKNKTKNQNNDNFTDIDNEISDINEKINNMKNKKPGNKIQKKSGKSNEQNETQNDDNYFDDNEMDDTNENVSKKNNINPKGKNNKKNNPTNKEEKTMTKISPDKTKSSAKTADKRNNNKKFHDKALADEDIKKNIKLILDEEPQVASSHLASNSAVLRRKKKAPQKNLKKVILTKPSTVFLANNRITQNKVKRYELDKKYKFNLRSITKDDINNIKELSEGLFTEEFNKKIFNEDFKKQIEALKEMKQNLDKKENINVYLENMDIILKVIGIRFINNLNPSLIKNFYEFMDSLYIVIKNSEYKLSFIESNIIFILLMDKFSINNTPMKAHLVKLMHKYVELLDPNKIMIIVLGLALNSNNKIKSNILDLVIRLCSENLLNITTRNYIKILCRFLETNDNVIKTKIFYIFKGIYISIKDELWGALDLREKELEFLQSNLLKDEENESNLNEIENPEYEEEEEEGKNNIDSSEGEPDNEEEGEEGEEGEEEEEENEEEFEGQDNENNDYDDENSYENDNYYGDDEGNLDYYKKKNKNYDNLHNNNYENEIEMDLDNIRKGNNKRIGPEKQNVLTTKGNNNTSEQIYSKMFNNKNPNKNNISSNNLSNNIYLNLDNPKNNEFKSDKKIVVQQKKNPKPNLEVKKLKVQKNTKGNKNNNFPNVSKVNKKEKSPENQNNKKGRIDNENNNKTLISSTGGITSEKDLLEIMSNLLSDDESEKLNTIIIIHEILCSKYQENKLILIPCIDNIILIFIKITHKLFDVENIENIPVKFAKYLVTILCKLASNKELIMHLSYKVLYDLSYELLSYLLINDLDKIGDNQEGNIIFKSLNSAMLRVLENTDTTSVILALLEIIKQSQNNTNEHTLSNLAIKCLIKATQDLPNILPNIQLDKILLQMHLLLVNYENLDNNERKTQADILIVRFIKNFIIDVTKLKKEKILEDYAKSIRNHKHKDKHIFVWIKNTLENINRRELKRESNDKMGIDRKINSNEVSNNNEKDDNDNDNDNEDENDNDNEDENEEENENGNSIGNENEDDNENDNGYNHVHKPAGINNNNRYKPNNLPTKKVQRPKKAIVIKKKPNPIYKNNLDTKNYNNATKNSNRLGKNSSIINDNNRPNFPRNEPKFSIANYLNQLKTKSIELQRKKK